MTNYPMGPLSLVQLEYFHKAVALHVRCGRLPADTDPYDYGVKTVARLGIYPTYGHLDVMTRRWYTENGNGQEIGLQLTFKGAYVKVRGG